MITKAETAELVAQFGKEFGKGENDTGCTAVQVAILTRRVNNLAGHFKANTHDYHSNRGLLKMIGQRKSLLRYAKKRNPGQYQDLIKKLGLRK